MKPVFNVINELGQLKEQMQGIINHQKNIDLELGEIQAWREAVNLNLKHHEETLSTQEERSSLMSKNITDMAAKVESVYQEKKYDLARTILISIIIALIVIIIIESIT